MKQEEKELLLKDLCTRLPYGFKAHIINDGFYDIREPYDTFLNIANHYLVTDLKRDSSLIIQPYLRPLSSMTEKEKKELKDKDLCIAVSSIIMTTTKGFDWLNEHYFDYRDLIPKGLALKALKGMYNIK